MKTIILLGGFGSRMRPHTWSRPKALMNVAGNTVLGHLLDELKPITTNKGDEVIFVVGYKGDEIRAWVKENYSHLTYHFVVQEQALGQAHAVWLCRDFLDDDGVVVGFGDAYISADYANFAQPDFDAVFLVEEVDDPTSYGIVKTTDENIVTAFVEKPDTKEDKKAVCGINWFKNGNELKKALDYVMENDLQTKGEYYMADAYQVMIDWGAKITTAPVSDWLDAGQPQMILATNARLLQLGFNTQDAIERSYGEDFTVMAPVYIHPDAKIEHSVIGPYVSVGADAVIRNSVISNSIIDPKAIVENTVLAHALVGEKAEVVGTPKALFVGDNSKVEL